MHRCNIKSKLKIMIEVVNLIFLLGAFLGYISCLSAFSDILIYKKNVVNDVKTISTVEFDMESIKNNKSGENVEIRNPTPIDKMVLPGRKKKVIKHLRYISNDFEKIRENHLDIEECIGLIKNMLDEFECDVQILENRICDLDIKDKVVIKLVESLVLDSKFLIIHEFEEEYLQNIIKYLNLLKTKYHRCILVFTYSEHILPYFDEIVSI